MTQSGQHQGARVNNIQLRKQSVIKVIHQRMQRPQKDPLIFTEITRYTNTETGTHPLLDGASLLWLNLDPETPLVEPYDADDADVEVVELLEL